MTGRGGSRRGRHVLAAIVVLSLLAIAGPVAAASAGVVDSGVPAQAAGSGVPAETADSGAGAPTEFELVETSADVDVGESGTVTVTVRNGGSTTARDATVTLRSGSSEVRFGQSASASRFAGTVEPGETVTLSYSVRVVPGAERQNYAIQATVGYLDDEGTPRQSRPLSFGLTPGPAQEFAVRDVAGDLHVGEEATLEGRLVNEGDEPVRDVVLLVETHSPVVSPLEVEYPVGRLGPGESSEFAFDVEISEGADAGPKRFSFVVEYRTGDGQRLRSDPVDVIREVGPRRDVLTVEPVDATVTAGGSTSLTLKVTNARNETLRDVSAKLFVDDPLDATDSEAFVGALEAGESTTITFGLGAGGGAMAKTYPASVDFQYRDAEGDTRLTRTYSIAVEVTRPDRRGLPLPLLAGVGAAVALGAVGLAVHRFR